MWCRLFARLISGQNPWISTEILQPTGTVQCIPNSDAAATEETNVVFLLIDRCARRLRTVIHTTMN